MKFFTYQLVASANDWIQQTEEEQLQSEKLFWAAAEAYERQLEGLRSRVSGPAWDFFRHGFGHDGLHDARLVLLSVGDGIYLVSDGSSSLSTNRRVATAKVEFLNREQDLHYTFDMRGVSRLQCDLFGEGTPHAGNIGDLYTYELTSTDDENLELGLLFASGATVTVQFRRLVFRKRRIKSGKD